MYADGTHWTTPYPDYRETMNHVGPTSTNSRTATLRTVCDLALRYPVAVACVPEDDPELIYIGHTFTVFPLEPTNRSNIDGFLNMLVAARDAEVSSFTYAASSSTYGDSKELLPDRSP